jgi:hypothetical protein
VKGKYHFGDLDIDGRIILKHIFTKEGVDWINLAQDGGKWQAVVNMVPNLWVP